MVTSKSNWTAKLNCHSSTLRVSRAAGLHWDCPLSPWAPDGHGFPLGELNQPEVQQAFLERIERCPIQGGPLLSGGHQPSSWFGVSIAVPLVGQDTPVWVPWVQQRLPRNWLLCQDSWNIQLFSLPKKYFMHYFINYFHWLCQFLILTSKEQTRIGSHILRLLFWNVGLMLLSSKSPVRNCQHPPSTLMKKPAFLTHY